MARCEICGQLSFDLKPIRLEGTLMQACPKCAKYGEPERIQKASSPPQKRTLESKKPRIPKQPSYRKDQYGLVPGFGEKIRNVRESKDLTREELAKKLQVKASYLAKLELEKIHPSDKMTKKIESMLEIKLLSQLEPVDTVSSKKALSKMTLGDIVRVIDEKPD